MMRFLSGFRLRLPERLPISPWRPPLKKSLNSSLIKPLSAGFVCLLCMACSARAFGQSPPSSSPHEYFIDCSAAGSGEGSLAHPWNSLAQAETHAFVPDDVIRIARGSTCKGSFAPKGSGTEGHIIRLTAYGVGPRPRIVAPSTARQAFLLFNQQYWQVDSLDISGGNTYGVFVTGDQGTLHHLYLKNLYVHDVYGGKFHNKDNGLVLVGPSSMNVFFDDVLVDGVDAAHTNQWAGILVGGGSFPYKDDAPRNTNVHIRNSTVHDVYGDGIVLFRDARSSIRTSAAWETGMEPTQDVGTPNAIWTWTCNDCIVADNEAYLTDSPGVDGGAYDIDWNDQNNTVENNYAHDTQGYCIAVFGAGYVTSDSIIRGNLCIDNALSPRMAASEGAIQLSTWNGGTIRGLTIQGNQIHWNPSVPGAAAIVAPADVGGHPIVFSGNTIESTSLLICRIATPWQSSGNTYFLHGGAPLFAIGGKSDLTLAALQSEGMESGSLNVVSLNDPHEDSLRLEARMNLALGQDGLLSDDARALLLVLRSLAGQYSEHRLEISIHLPGIISGDGFANALRDLDDVYPHALKIVRDTTRPPGDAAGAAIRLLSADGRVLQSWSGVQNAATLGGAIRKLLGPPDYSHMQPLETAHDFAEAPQ
jgi:hypothetical protein